MTLLFARPYNLNAHGFYFDSVKRFQEQAEGLTDKYGNAVYHFEILFINGEEIDAALLSAFGLHQDDIHHYFEAVATWSREEKLRVIIAIDKCAYPFEENGIPNDVAVEFYECDSLRELAEHFIESGEKFGTIPAKARKYLDMNAILDDLGKHYFETTIANARFVYRF